MIKVKILSTILIFFGMSGFCFSQEPNEPADFLSADFHKQRRELLRDKMPANSVAIFFANPVRNRANDVDYIYHQDPDFYYLTGYREPHAVLLIFKDFQQTQTGNQYNELIFVQPRNPRAEQWTGIRLGTDGVREKLEISEAFDNKDFAAYEIDFDGFDQVLFYDFYNDVRDTPVRGDLFDLIESFKLKAGYGPEKFSAEPSRNNLNRVELKNLMADLRGIKTNDELTLLRKAVDISCIGQLEVMKAIKPGMSEREIQGIHEFVFRKYGSEYQGYPSIVGSGHNGCILHYIDNHKPEISSKDLILMDLGAEYRGYTADVTRTIPINGKFSPEQKAIYDLVLKAQEAAMKECVAGVRWNQPLATARRIINEGLAELGIISSPDERHGYFPHGISHHIGLDVHDKGNTSRFEADMVITVEPGIYIPEGADCDEKWWGIAVRIEDCILIKESGEPELLSFRAPRKSDEIEEMMKQSSVLEQFILPDLDK